jgi:4-amino-4-deoxy-L-arabinose transferase-like glycosyltransferase
VRPERAGRWWWAGLAFVVLVYLHNTLPHLTTMPRVNVDEPWLMERAYQVQQTGVPAQPMLRLHQAYMLQVGYGYLVAPWFGLVGVGLFQARLFGVLLGLGILLLVASIGRRTIDATAGLAAALFLAADSNFLGGVRNARTDIPSVFFVALALCAYVIGRERSRAGWFVASGAAVGVAMLFHGNAFWLGPILLVWYLRDYGRRALTAPFGYAFLGGLLLTFGPYLAVVAMRWADVRTQIGNFAGDRVPGWRPAFLLQQVMLEAQRYRNWYFGLVTNAVPNPLLWAFQAAVLTGIGVLVLRAFRPRPALSLETSRAALSGPPDAGLKAPRYSDRGRDTHGPARLLILAVGAAFIFAAFINNKVAVYMPHLLIGFSLAAGAAVSEAAALARRIGPRAAALTVAVFLAGYGTAAIAYYEKWYASAGKSELVAYESTEATLHALVPPGPKYLFASPQFWTSFHAEAGTTFYSYAAAQPGGTVEQAALPEVGVDRPIFLVVDELQWLPELSSSISQSSSSWQRDWIAFIERHCALDGTALGTAHGTLALYRCALTGKPAGRPDRLVGGNILYELGTRALSQTSVDLASWPRYDDPRRTPAGRPQVRPGPQGLEISGTGWPGIVKTFDATPGERYLVRATTARTRDGDLLYLGTWQRPEVLSLGGASSAGIPAQLVKEPWFPHDRAFVATSSSVRIAVYSEAPETDFVVASLDIYRLEPLKKSPAAN